MCLYVFVVICLVTSNKAIYQNIKDLLSADYFLVCVNAQNKAIVDITLCPWTGALFVSLVLGHCNIMQRRRHLQNRK